MSKFVTNEKPPMIIHVGGRPRSARAIIARCCANIYLSGRAKKLLQFYASQAEGFPPALKLVARETGIAFNKVSEVRKEIADHGLIEYDRGSEWRQGHIKIQWLKIRTFAALSEPIHMSRPDREAHKTRGLNPYKPRVAIHIDKAKRKPLIAEHHGKLNEDPEVAMLEVLGSMTWSQYEDVIGRPAHGYIVIPESDSNTGYQIAKATSKYQASQARKAC